MRRADRLFRIIQRLRRRRRAITSRELATALEVSERTIYRDIAHLVGAGVPIRGEAGVGYLLESGYELPPLMFNEQEIEALVLGARIVRGWADPELAAAAQDALSKVETVLPPRLREKLETTPLFAINFRRREEDARSLATLREAIHGQRHVAFEYVDVEGQVTRRTVRPLGLFYWGSSWTLGAWCELREGFRSFRVDRIADLEQLESRFEDEAGRTLADLFRYYEARDESTG